MLDHIALRRPWGLVLKAAKAVARFRLRGLAPGITVIVVNWNTKNEVRDVLEAVKRFSPPQTAVLVIDNGSTDGSPELLRSIPDIRLIRLPSNAGHGVALDLAMYLVRTSIAVTLDSDAFPFAASWLEQVSSPVRSGTAVLAGLRSRRNFVHPVLLAVDTAEFVKNKWSFQVHWSAGVDGRTARWGVDAWDTAELLTKQIDARRVTFVEATPNIVDGLPGMTVGGVVYHHGGVSRSTTDASLEAARRQWSDALQVHGLRSTLATDGRHT